jgi:tetratricopeptide (TPR) repeat protein
VFAVGIVFTILLAVFRPKTVDDLRRSDAPTASGVTASGNVITDEARFRKRSGLVQTSNYSPSASVEEIVARKVNEFTRSRREMIRAISRRTGKDIPSEVDRFFDALEAGDWDEIDLQFAALAKRSGQYADSTGWPELNPFWPTVLDAYGAAEQAHLWPAQKLLDYGNAILDSLRPGMVYVGGTDHGRWIPELLNDTSDGERHLMLTQNALADTRYREFLTELYGDRLVNVTQEDSDRIFNDYVADARRRLEHDQQFPDEPKQVLPGEDIRIAGEKVHVSGQVAVMAINERILAMLMEKNPGMSFALEESFPFKGTYADALPLGPLMELNARDENNTFTAERANQYLDHWRNSAQQILSDPESAGSSTALKSYSHDTSAAANFLAAHNFAGEAEQAYRLATQLWPENPEPIGGLADLLVRIGREDEARNLFQDFIQRYPDQKKEMDRLSAAWRLIGSATSGSP